MPYELSMPTSLDALHLVLAGTALLLLLITLLLVLKRGGGGDKANSSAKEPPSPKQQSSIETPMLNTKDPESAFQLLGLLQQEARFVDFLNEDLTGFKDDEVGAVARVVHEGSKKVLHQYFQLEPIRAEDEDSQITLQIGFSAAENRVTGNVSGEPPFTGVLVHRGWRVTGANLPKLAVSHDPKIVAPAEVEL